jgi:hypothetical protein
MSVFELFRQTCDGCGAAIDDMAKHVVWHEGLSEITRLVVAPDVSKEDWAEAAEQAAARRREDERS